LSLGLPDHGLRAGTFDVLASNPPFAGKSVRDLLRLLDDANAAGKCRKTPAPQDGLITGVRSENPALWKTSRISQMNSATTGGEKNWPVSQRRSKSLRLDAGMGAVSDDETVNRDSLWSVTRTGIVGLERRITSRQGQACSRPALYSLLESARGAG
jgi:hypothetical protein